MPTTEYAPYRGTHKCSDIDAAIDRSIANATAIAEKQDELTTAQLAAVNSGIDSTKVAAIATNTSEVSSLGTEIQNARENPVGTVYQTLSARLNTEYDGSRKVSKNVLGSCDLNSISGNNTFILTTAYSYTHSPLTAGVLMTYELQGTWKLQIMYALGGHGVYKRNVNVSGNWTDWISIENIPENQLGNNTDKTVSQDFMTKNVSGFSRSAEEFATTVGSTTTLYLSDIKKPGYYLVSGSWSIPDAPYGLTVTGVKVEKYPEGNVERFLKQTVESVGMTGDYYSYYRYTNYQGEYMDWKHCGRKGFMFSEPQLLSSCDLNDLTDDAFWLMPGSQTYVNAPYYDAQGQSTGILMQSNLANSWKFQIWYSFTSADTYKRIGKTGNWQAWAKINGGNGTSVTYEVTQNINRDEITNTYNITTTPTITTDSNGWLQAVDTDTSSETSKTDMSGAILSMLTNTGYCHLAPGIYYVTGFDMPPGSTLEGCGKNTIVRLLSSVNSGYTCRIGQNCTVKNICFSGGYNPPSDVTTEGASLGSRHGIYCVANADGEEASAPNTSTNLVEGCFFENYDGSAFYNHNTGYTNDSVVIMSDCRMIKCKVGINIDYFAEYAKYSNILIYNCNHACINNGGNNVFTSCTFHGVVGFLIDNSDGTKTNNSHGSAIGCTFNHINNMNQVAQHGGGDAILVKGATSGYLFTNCQIWYGAVKIENSRGITVQSTLFGGGSPKITVSGDYPAFIQNSIFMDSPTLDCNSSTIFNGCYTKTGVPVINQ